MNSPMPAGALSSKLVFEKYEAQFQGMVWWLSTIDLDAPFPPLYVDIVNLYFGDWQEIHVEVQPYRKWEILLRDGWAWDTEHTQAVSRASVVRRHVQNLEQAGMRVKGVWDFSVFDKFIVADYANSSEAYVISMDMSADWELLTHWDQLERITK